MEWKIWTLWLIGILCIQDILSTWIKSHYRPK